MNTDASTPPPSDLALQKAWRFLAQRNWPASLEATLADPMRARLIRMYARDLERRWARNHKAPFDLKRAAAGDLAD
jgi:hypothetical protein